MSNYTLEQILLEEERRKNVDITNNPYVSDVAQPGPGTTLNAFQMDSPYSVAQALKFFAGKDADIDAKKTAGHETATLLQNAGVAMMKENALQLAAQPTQTVPTKAFLNPRFIEGTILRKIGPQVPFLDLATNTRVKETNITYFMEEYSWFTDPKMRRAAAVGEGGDEGSIVGGTDPNEKNTAVVEYKLKMIFTKRAMRNDVVGFNEVQRKLNLMTMATAKTWNDIYADTIANEFSTVVNAAKPTDEQVEEFIAVNGAWSTGGSTPLDDILDAQLQMKTNTDDYRSPTELWLNADEYSDLFRYLHSQDHDWALNPLTGRESSMININGIAVREIPPDSGMTASKGLMLDRSGLSGASILDTWDIVDTKHSRSGLISVQRIDDEPRGSGNVVFQVSREFACANRDPKAVLVMHSI